MIDLSDIQVVLASASPRRKELLQQIGIEPVIIPSDYAEQSGGSDVLLLIENNTKGKLNDVLMKNNLRHSLIIAADTVVVLDCKVFGKPSNADEAIAMLENLSGKKHQVITGVAIYYNTEIMYYYSVTDVYMRTIRSEEIKAYIKTGEPYDKAGGYGIQAIGALFVDKIDGCYSNVVGLPLPLVYKMLGAFGMKIL